MANIKSAKKRILVTEKRTAKNKSVRSKVKTAIKKVDAAIAANDKAAAEAALKVAVSELDKATKKGIYHKNTTARKVSRMTIATVSDDETFEQIKKQLNRLVEVIKVIDFTDVFVRMKEILYVKVRKCSKDDKVECFQIAETFKAKIIDYGKDSVLLEFVQTATKNDAVIKLMKEEFTSIEVVRGGSVGIESISMMER